MEHELKPYKRAQAPPNSMSARIGTDAQPIHTDAAFWPRPPRYIALQCINPGEANCPTCIWELDVSALGADQRSTLSKVNWVSSGGSRTPFYCSVLEFEDGVARLRYDPFSMRSICGICHNEVQDAMKVCAQRLDFFWEHRALLVIDNWRHLHARGPGAAHAPSRLLRRWAIR